LGVFFCSSVSQYLVLRHGRVHRGSGLIHISHDCLLILVFLRFLPFAKVNRILEIGAIFLIFFGGFWLEWFLHDVVSLLSKFCVFRSVLMWICEFLELSNLLLCALSFLNRASIQ
jgi:hypothetical protein